MTCTSKHALLSWVHTTISTTVLTAIPPDGMRPNYKDPMAEWRYLPSSSWQFLLAPNSRHVCEIQCVLRICITFGNMHGMFLMAFTNQTETFHLLMMLPWVGIFLVQSWMGTSKNTIWFWWCVSLDGAQLYNNKHSDCWMYIWIILNLPLDKCYLKVNILPSRFIPGPNKLKNIDLFLFPGFHHLAVLQCEGLQVWGSLTNMQCLSDTYLMFTTADGPVLVYWDGMVGHSSRNGCHLYCGVLGCHKDHGNHYYPALLCPCDHPVLGSDHTDIDVFRIPQGGSIKYMQNLMKIVSVANQMQWDRMKTETGLTKPPLILGLPPAHSLGVPVMWKQLQGQGKECVLVRRLEDDWVEGRLAQEEHWRFTRMLHVSRSGCRGFSEESTHKEMLHPQDWVTGEQVSMVDWSSPYSRLRLGSRVKGSGFLMGEMLS